MRIGIDARVIKVRRGIGNALHALLIGLSQIGWAHIVYIYVDDGSARSLIPKDPRFNIRMLGNSQYPIGEQVLLPLAAKRDTLDILHCPANTAPVFLSSSCRLVLTVHDVIFMGGKIASRAPFRQGMQNLYYRLFVPVVARHANLILTVSEHSKAEISATLGVPPQKLEVVNNALPEVVNNALPGRDPGQNAQSGAVLSSASQYFLALAAEDPRKNTTGILHAFRRFITLGFRGKLALVGLTGAFRSRMVDEIDRLGLTGYVVEYGFVDDAMLSKLYAGARALLYPSFSEGFGMPIVEAMSRGTPVITSNASALPEIAGGAALLIDPSDPNSIAQAMIRIVSDPALVLRLSDLGRSRSSHFSPQRMALETLEAYEKAYASKN